MMGRAGVGRTIVLAGMLVLAVGWLVVRLREGTAIASLLATGSVAPAWTKADLSLPGSGPDLAGLRDRPLMYATRSPYVPPPPDNTVLLPPPPGYRLAGAMIVPGKPARALLAPISDAGTMRWVKPGDDMDGWTVLTVEMNRVVLLLGEQEAQITKSEQTPQALTLARAPVGSRGIPNAGTTLSAPGGSGEGLLLSASGSPSGPSLPRGKAALLNQPRLYRPPPSQ